MIHTKDDIKTIVIKLEEKCKELALSKGGSFSRNPAIPAETGPKNANNSPNNYIYYCVSNHSPRVTLYS